MSLKIVIGEDQALLRQGIVRLLGDAGFDVVAEAADAPDLLRKVARTSRTWRSWTSRCRPTTPTTGCARRSRSARRSPDVGVLVLSQHAEERYALDLIGDSAEGVGYLLKDRVTDFARSPTRSGASAPAARCSTRPSSRACSAGGAATIRWTR